MIRVILDILLTVLGLVLGFLVGFQVCNNAWKDKIQKLTNDILEIADEAMKKKEKKL